MDAIWYVFGALIFKVLHVKNLESEEFDTCVKIRK